MTDGRIPLLVELDPAGKGAEIFEAVLGALGLTVAWDAQGGISPRDGLVPALHLEHLGQVHADLHLESTVRRLGAEGPVDTALALRRRFREAGLTALVDWSEGRMEGAVEGSASWVDPWWVSEILGGDPRALDPDGALGRGVTVALADHPVDRLHPALRERCLAPIEAWSLPWYQAHRVIPDDHGTGGAGLVAGWDPSRDRRPGVAPGAEILPVHLWPGPGIGLRPDRVRIVCRGLDGLRRRQVEAGTSRTWIWTQQISLTNLTFGRALQDQYEDAVSVLERAYARAAGDWQVAVLAAAGSHPRARWPVLPGGLAGVTSVGAVDEEDRPVRRSPRFGMDLVCRLSKAGRGPLSCAAGGGYIEQGQATSAAAPLAAGALAALVSREGLGTRRALRLLRKRGRVLEMGATLVSLDWAS